MSLQELIAPSLETLKAHYATNKLLLIHPSSRYRTLLIAALLDSPPAPLYFFGFGIGDVSLSQFLSSLSSAMADQAPLFGQHLNEEITRASGDIPALAQALAADLTQLSDDHYLLIIDEYDRIDEVAEIQNFFEQLLRVLPNQCHLLINSRTLPRLPWVALVARKQAVVLRDARLLPSGFYSEHFSESPNVEVYAFGPGYVMLNGQHVTSWEGHLPRLLFFFTLDRPQCTRADICEAFWPDLSLDQAVNVFHVTKRRLHKALHYDDMVTHVGGHYQVNPRMNVQYDVLEFVASLVEARSRSGDEAEPHWQHAIDIYRGHFLQAHDDPWIVARRSDFLEGYLEALTELAHIREDQGKTENALGLVLRALSDAHHREDLHREALRLYSKLGRRSEAVEYYRKLEQDLQDKYGTRPSPETVKVFKEVSGG